MATEIVVDREGQGERLDKFLVRHLAGQSRSQIQKLIEQGSVTVNNKIVTAHRFLQPNDQITIAETSVKESVQPLPRSLPQPPIIFEDEHLLVINKPSGLTVHPGAGVRGPTLIDWLMEHVPSISAVGDDLEQRPGIVHRLDKEVSGVMVIAKTQAAFEHLKQQFQERSVDKEYVALVHGIPKNSSGTIDFPIARSRRQHGRMSARRKESPVPLLAEEGDTGGGSREATTHYELERIVKKNALLRVRIETGRTHQIRVHLKAIGHPIVGDGVYTTKPFRRKKSELQRPFLHARRIAFTDLHGQRREFTAPLPEELRRML